MGTSVRFGRERHNYTENEYFSVKNFGHLKKNHYLCAEFYINIKSNFI